jgi:hypothetical protein
MMTATLATQCNFKFYGTFHLFLFLEKNSFQITTCMSSVTCEFVKKGVVQYARQADSDSLARHLHSPSEGLHAKVSSG